MCEIRGKERARSENMTDEEYILSIIKSNYDFCSTAYERKNDSKLNVCYFCPLCGIESKYPCWQRRLADILMKVIPQLDCDEKNPSIEEKDEKKDG